MRLVLPLIAFAITALFDWAEPLLARNPEIIAAPGRLQAERLAHSDSVAASLSIEEQQIVKSAGMAGFLRERIARFFGKPAG